MSEQFKMLEHLRILFFGMRNISFLIAITGILRQISVVHFCTDGNSDQT